jgi:hypothetical protein
MPRRIEKLLHVLADAIFPPVLRTAPVRAARGRRGR